MPVYTVSFAAVALTAPQDLFELNTPSTRRAKIIGWVVNQSTEFGDAQDEQVRLELYRGHTTSGSGGSAPTPVPVSVAEPAALCTAEANNTTLATGGSPVLLHSTCFNVRAGDIWLPVPEQRPVIAVSSRAVLRLNTTPADSISFSGTLYFEE